MSVGREPARRDGLRMQRGKMGRGIQSTVGHTGEQLRSGEGVSSIHQKDREAWCCMGTAGTCDGRELRVFSCLSFCLL